MTIKTMGTQKESKVIELEPKQSQYLHYTVEYDTMKPEDALRDFVGDVKNMLSRYEANKLRIVEIEAQLCDMEHWIEIAPYQNVPNGYKLYRKLAELRRERRARKNENDLLWPIYEHFHATEVLNKLTRVQGECSKAKGGIDGRTYQVRTDILDEYLEEKKPVKQEEPEEIVGIDLNDTSWLPDLELGEEIKKTIVISQAQEKVDQQLQKAKYELAWKAAEA